ncbi:GNAT family N-acetyltransferase [Photobacterium sp. CCB-ST2H9]|uniref:GNAT family N-acetyltransferase n=1 Tax=unclassified Photobacterium TaxID=2628852 RepID=UPI002005ED47|nr:GNAT family N-acetyltransferase [Photobacterium sp. CCB-ST2H9]UTM59679.1 GNAT family N-acetyltransferase [Photobacterium sp. CCB-ST2H9]
MSFSFTTEPADDDLLAIREGLRAHNLPHLSQIEHQPVACFYQDEQGQKLGGISGAVWGNWLQIDFLWVDPSLQHLGIGGKLLTQVEAYARAQGCHSVLLDTFSFQARPFYEKQGYHCVMTLEDFPRHSNKHFMMKSLVDE